MGFGQKKYICRIVAALLLALSCLPLSIAKGSGLSFQDADIRVVIEAVSKLTGKNFIVDPRVKGKVTMISSSELSEESLYEVFLSILETHNYIAVPTGHNAIKILPEMELRTEAAEISVDGKSAPDSEISLKVFKVENDDASSMVPILRPLVSRSGGHIAAHPGSNNIIVSDTRRNVEKIARLIKKMDVAREEAVRMVQLNNAIAVEVLPILKPILAQKQKNGGKSAGRSSVAADGRTNSLLVKAPESDIDEIVSIIKKLDRYLPDENIGDTAVVKLRYAKAKNVVEILNKMLGITSKSRKDSIIFDSDALPHISMDEKANSVIIAGAERYVKKIKKLIKTIDVKRTQVMVEALIVDISAGKAKQLGIQWNAAASSSGVTVSGLTTITPSLSAGNLSQLVGAIKGGRNIAFGALAEALASDTDTNLISAPSITTMENEEAEIEVGQEVPFVTGSYTATANNLTNNPFQTIERKNVGLKLKITPQINKGNVIHLSVEQEFSSVDPTAKTTLGAVDIVTKKRTIKTNVLVNDGSILVLGGLIDDSVNETRSRVLGLSKIPLLGRLFRHRGTTKDKNNLMVFIRPKIVDNVRAATAITKNRYNYMRRQQLAKDRKGVQLMKDERQPVLKNVYRNIKTYIKKKRKKTRSQAQAAGPGVKHKDKSHTGFEGFDVLSPDY